MSHRSPRTGSVHLEILESRRLLAQTPFLGVPFHIGTTGTTTIQAEDFDNGGEGVAYHDVDAANLGGQYRKTGVDIGVASDEGGGFYVSNVKAGEWLEYTLNTDQEGSYNLLLRMATIGLGGKFHVEVNGIDVTGPSDVVDTNGWQHWGWQLLTLNLPGGQSVLRISMDANAARGSVANFNYFQIVEASTEPQPPGQSPYLRGYYQIGLDEPRPIGAAYFDNGGEGVAYHDLDAANLGKKLRVTGVDVQFSSDRETGSNVGWTKAGEWLEYTVNVVQAGTYQADFRVANTGNNGKFHLEIDGVNVTGSLTVPNTGGFQNWTTLSKTDLNFPAGQHVLRLAMDTNFSNGSVGNFLDINITPGSPGTHTDTLTNTISTYIRDGKFIDTNYGSDPQLIVKNSTLDYNREAYLRFDLSFVQTVSSAKLGLWGRLSELTSAVEIALFSDGDVTFREDELTWNNNVGTLTPIGTTAISGTVAQWYEFDVTQYLKQAATPEGHGVAAFALKSNTFSGGPQVVFNSDDAADHRPELVVTS